MLKRFPGTTCRIPSICACRPSGSSTSNTNAGNLDQLIQLLVRRLGQPSEPVCPFIIEQAGSLKPQCFWQPLVTTREAAEKSSLVSSRVKRGIRFRQFQEKSRLLGQTAPSE